MNKIAILHFQPLEKYPPIMNLLKILDHSSNINVKVFTTPNKSNRFEVENINVYRLGYLMNSTSKRYLTYLLFNIKTLIHLLILRPSAIVIFETYSVFPVWFYNKFSSKTPIYIHFHEFSTNEEQSIASKYLNFLYSCENILLHRAIWISHTNEDRLRLFRKQKPNIEISKLFILPNYPLQKWATNHHIIVQKNTTIKMVYVGALDTNTMHLELICNWLIKQEGKYSLDLISDNISISAHTLLKESNFKYVEILPPCSYYNLPEFLSEYNIGLVLYNGHIPNYIYNLPNKVTEYLHCGLNVWYPTSLLTTTYWAVQNKLTEINNENLPEGFAGISAFNFNPKLFCAEEALKPLIDNFQSTTE